LGSAYSPVLSVSDARVQRAHRKTELVGMAFRFEVTRKTENSNRRAKSGCATSEPGDRANINREARAEGLQA
jgi:hypothetical protein